MKRKKLASRLIKVLAPFLIVAVVLGCLIGPTAIRYSKQRRAAEEFEKYDVGNVFVRYRGPTWLFKLASDDCRNRYVEAQTTSCVAPEWARKWIGAAGWDSLIRIHDAADSVRINCFSSNESQSTAAISCLTHFSTLDAVHINIGEGANPDLKVLGNLPHLRVLLLWNCLMTEELRIALQRCGSLSFLIFQGAASDDEFTQISQLTRLEYLDVRSNFRVSDRSLALLKSMPRLKGVEIYVPAGSEAAIADLKSEIPGKIEGDYSPLDAFTGFDRPQIYGPGGRGLPTWK